MRNLVIEAGCLEDFLEIAATDKQNFKRIATLIKQIRQEPFGGIGKPEALKHQLAGYWSRRINEKDRLVYKITENEIIIVSCRSHYGEK